MEQIETIKKRACLLIREDKHRYAALQVIEINQEMIRQLLNICEQLQRGVKNE